MSFQSLTGRLEQIHIDAQLLVDRARLHQDQLAALVASAERDVTDAEGALADVRHARPSMFRNQLDVQLGRFSASVTTARQLCVSARLQHVAAVRLLDEVDCCESAAEHTSHRRLNTVLVVDDTSDVRDAVAEVLERAGFVVRTASNGLEGLIAAYEMRPGVIVMDVTMPVLDGIEATRLIKAKEETRDARVVAFTGNASLGEGIAERLFFAVLHKPATPDLIVATVQRAGSL